MKLVIQRVNKAKVTVKKTGEVVGSIDNGLFILVGFKKGDTKAQVDVLVNKLIKLRVMPDTNEKMNLSVVDAKASLLVVSQFTLYADTSGGNRPSFINAEDPDKAKVLYDYFIQELKNQNMNVATGSFGDYMIIETENDGPVTILFEN